MPDLARPVLEYIYNLTIKDRLPGFLLVEKDGCVQDWGGELEIYGITGLKKGDPIEDHLFVLDGIFPFEEEEMHLPCMETETGRSADIHIFSSEKGCWVLFLDASEEEAKQSILQQRVNELCLLRDKHIKLLDQYLGKEVAEKLVLPSAKAMEESKYVSTLFAAIRGFTAYSKQTSPSNVFKLLNAYLGAIIQPVLDGGGRVDKIIGEAVTAIFSDLPSERPPCIQAVNAAFQIIANVRSLQKDRMDSGKDILDIGIGITSGQVFLGVLGSQNRRALGAVGHNVNLASLLETQARSNEILIDEQTFKNIKEIQDHFTKTTLRLREMEIPLQVYTCERIKEKQC